MNTRFLDLLLREVQPECVLKATTAKSFELPLEDVSIVKELESFPDFGQYGVVCMVQIMPSGFRQLLSLYIFSGIKATDYEIAVRYVSFLKTECMLASDSNDPYEMVLVDLAGDVKSVHVDVKQLDEDGVYCIS